MLWLLADLKSNNKLGQMQGSRKEVIKAKLKLEPHKLHGYFREIYKSRLEHGKRCLMTTIYYMLTDDSPFCSWHSNKSDITHFHHHGGRLHYLYIDASTGELFQHILSSNILQGEQPQLTVPANAWKASVLLDGDYGLISQAVAPGFDYEDQKIISCQELIKLFPQHKEAIQYVERHRKEPSVES